MKTFLAIHIPYVRQQNYRNYPQTARQNEGNDYDGDEDGSSDTDSEFDSECINSDEDNNNYNNEDSNDLVGCEERGDTSDVIKTGDDSEDLNKGTDKELLDWQSLDARILENRYGLPYSYIQHVRERNYREGFREQYPQMNDDERPTHEDFVKSNYNTSSEKKQSSADPPIDVNTNQVFKGQDTTGYIIIPPLFGW